MLLSFIFSTIIAVFCERLALASRTAVKVSLLRVAIASISAWFSALSCSAPACAVSRSACVAFVVVSAISSTNGLSFSLMKFARSFVFSDNLAFNWLVTVEISCIFEASDVNALTFSDMDCVCAPSFSANSLARMFSASSRCDAAALTFWVSSFVRFSSFPSRSDVNEATLSVMRCACAPSFSSMDWFSSSLVLLMLSPNSPVTARNAS